jgi:DNA-binding transcriptional regulator LsrR (DeoR family)
MAGGAQKEEVVRAALRGGLIDVLITDHGLAQRLLQADS